MAGSQLTALLAGLRLSPATCPWPGAASMVHLPGPPRRGCTCCHASRPATQMHSRLRASTQDRLPPLTAGCAQGSLPPKTLPPPTLSLSLHRRPASRHIPGASECEAAEQCSSGCTPWSGTAPAPLLSSSVTKGQVGEPPCLSVP